MRYSFLYCRGGYRHSAHSFGFVSRYAVLLKAAKSTTIAVNYFTVSSMCESAHQAELFHMLTVKKAHRSIELAILLTAVVPIFRPHTL